MHDDARILVYVLALLALASGIAAIALSGDRRHTVSRLGVGTAIAGVAVVDILAGAPQPRLS